METLLYTLFVIICAVLILLILIQQGKGAGVGFSMGGASQAMFGGSGGRDVFIKVTSALAVAFALICIILARMAASDSQGYHGALA
ncbi:MAG: preprotein translocase subunit SecG, partial [bacterium]